MYHGSNTRTYTPRQKQTDCKQTYKHWVDKKKHRHTDKAKGQLNDTYSYNAYNKHVGIQERGVYIYNIKNMHRLPWKCWYTPK